jgi:cytochrome P450
MTERGQLEREEQEAADYGSDVSTFLRSDGIADLDPSFAVIRGPQVVAESVARSLMTRRGLMTEAPDRGIDLQQLQSARLSPQALRQLHAVIEREVRADDRVLDASVEVTAPEPQTLLVRVACATGFGPFELVIQSSRAGDLVEVLL